jgi:Zn-dependent M28 family amino/carboxypeptidase
MRKSNGKLDKELIGDIWLSDEIKKNLNYLTDNLNQRFAGTEGEHKAAEYIKNKFKKYGLTKIKSEEFQFQGWERESISFIIGKPYEIECHAIALPYSPPCNMESEIVDLGCGLEEDFKRNIKGKIVLVSSRTPSSHPRWIHRQEKYNRAVKGGASGFVFMNHLPGDLAATGSLQSNKIGKIPGIGISKETGERIKRLIASQNKTWVKLKIDVKISKALSHNVSGLIDPETENKELLICAHYDGHDISQAALDNASGTVTLLEIARMLSLCKDRLKKPVRFVTFGAEELGLIGSSHYAEKNDISNLEMVMNLDCTGNSNHILFFTCEFDEIANFIGNFSCTLDHPLSVKNEISEHSDHWPFVKKSIPGFLVSSENNEEGRGWGHTTADTLDKLDIRDLKQNIIVLLQLTLKLATTSAKFNK